MEHRFSFCRDFVLMGFRSIGTAFCRGDIQRCRYSCTLSSFLTYLTLRGGGGTRPAICANTFSVPPCWRPICSSQYPAGPALAVVRFHLLFYHSVSLFVLFWQATLLWTLHIRFGMWIVQVKRHLLGVDLTFYSLWITIMRNILNIRSDGISFCWDFVLSGFLSDGFRSHGPKSPLQFAATSPQQVGNFPVYGEVTGKRV